MSLANAAHVARYLTRVDAHLPTLANDAARRAFLNTEISKWSARFVAFVRDVDAGKEPPKDVQASDFHVTDGELRSRLAALIIKRDVDAAAELAAFADRVVTFETEGPTDQRFAAHYVGDEEKPVGAYGPTREAALQDLLDNYPVSEAAE